MDGPRVRERRSAIGGGQKGVRAEVRWWSNARRRQEESTRTKRKKEGDGRRKRRKSTEGLKYARRSRRKSHQEGWIKGE